MIQHELTATRATSVFSLGQVCFSGSLLTLISPVAKVTLVNFLVDRLYSRINWPISSIKACLNDLS